MFAPEELVVLVDKMEAPMFSLSIQIPNVPDFGDFEEMPRDPPILSKHLTDHLGDDESMAHSPDTMSLDGIELEEDSEQQDYIVIEVMEGYTCTICIANMTDEEIEMEIENKREEILEMILDGHDTLFD